MKDKAGSMGAGMAFGFAIGVVILTSVLGFVHVSYTILNILLYIAAGWAAVYMTKASTGKGILAFLVAGLVAGVVTAIQVKMAMGAVSAAASSAMADAAKQAAANGVKGADLNNALAQGGNALASGLSTMAMIMAFVMSLIRTFLFGMVGCFIGGAMKKSALGGGAAPAKA